MKEMKFSEFKRLCFCNSNKLIGKVFVIGGIPHEWVGIGIVECDLATNPDNNIEIVEE